jgi:hypothetical protein
MPFFRPVYVFEVLSDPLARHAIQIEEIILTH